jgi:predicted transcriptional regulator
MKQKRERLDIIHDILRVIRDNRNLVKPTHLLYKSNLSHKMMKEYLNELMEKRLISMEMKGKTTYYSLTDKGFEYLNKYSVVLDFMDSFGL